MKDRSPWVELHLSVVGHRKTWALANALNVDRVTALGHICSLWLWAVEQAQDGDLSAFPARAIAEAGGWRKAPQRFVTSLRAAGYLDKDSRLHEWDLYVGPLMEKRRKDRDRKRGNGADNPSDVARNSNGISDGTSVGGSASPSTSPSTSPSSSGGRSLQLPPLDAISPELQRAIAAWEQQSPGGVTPVILDKLSGWIQDGIPPEWIEEACRRAQDQGGYKPPSYMQPMFERWKRAGGINDASSKRGSPDAEQERLDRIADDFPPKPKAAP